MQDDAERISVSQIALLLLSILVIAALGADTMFTLPAEASRLLQVLDNGVCALFLLDFAIRFKRAPHKGEFLKWGWIDLLASVPNIDALRWGRLVRVVRVIRILRTIRSFQRVVAIVFRNRLRSGAAALLISAGLLIAFSSTAILLCENEPESNIRTAEDAVWWSVTTVTTVGYGDKYPVTLEGRVIAMILMAAGVGVFGTLSGLIASHFLSPSSQEHQERDALMAELKCLREKVDALNDHLSSRR